VTIAETNSKILPWFQKEVLRQEKCHSLMSFRMEGVMIKYNPKVTHNQRPKGGCRPMFDLEYVVSDSDSILLP
jgi:hypothetical protein